MTNEELDRARVDEAIRNGNGIVGSVALIAARLAREGWTPPEPVDPDLLEARRIAERVNREADYSSFAEAAYLGNEDNSEDVLCALAGIKVGRALATAEAKPGVVWVKHDYSSVPPRLGPGAEVVTICDGGHFNATVVGAIRDWTTIEYYMWIERPEDYEQ